MKIYKKTIKIKTTPEETINYIIEHMDIYNTSTKLVARTDHTFNTTTCSIRTFEHIAYLAKSYILLNMIFLYDATKPDELTIVVTAGGGSNQSMIFRKRSAKDLIKTLTNLIELKYPDDTDSPTADISK